MDVMDTIDITINLKNQITELQSLLSILEKKHNRTDKIKILNDLKIVKSYLSKDGPIQKFLENLSPEAEYAIKAIIAIGQAPIVFNFKQLDTENNQLLITLLEHLLELEIFYSHLGGIIGYHTTVLKLILEHHQDDIKISKHHHYIHPEGLNLNEDQPKVHEAVRWGIDHFHKIGMIYPLGGAGDRLNLREEITGKPLPAALLPFLGRTLLDGLMRDLQAEEYLFFKIHGKQCVTPIAIMTSIEKDNHVHIFNICKKSGWFGRSSENFHFFIQPLVPIITTEGNWALSAPLTLELKPCGHGALWKLAEEQKVFKWLEKHGRHQCLIRQINNPLAGTDHALFALIGVGCQTHKSMGFLSCERLLNSEEGTNVLIEEKKKDGYDYCLTNIEYTQFHQKGIHEVSAQPGSPYSTYPTNTNILFINISSIRELLKICPIPGQIINMKSKVPSLDAKGQLISVPGGRLESTMQNIADYIIDKFPHRLSNDEFKDKLSNFILYHQRSKTISTTKKCYHPGGSSYSTPEHAFYDMLSNHHTLLKQCGFDLPQWIEINEYLLKGPNFIFLFHPGLGPLYSVIRQKIRQGLLHQGAELQLEIAEIDIEKLSLDGSLVIRSKTPLGGFNSLNILEYGNESRVTLKNISVRNLGIDREQTRDYWKNAFVRKECVEIDLEEGSEFYAENLTLEGSHHFVVPSHHRLTLSSTPQGELQQELIPIDKPSWHWKYSYDSQGRINIKRIE